MDDIPLRTSHGGHGLEERRSMLAAPTTRLAEGNQSTSDQETFSAHPTDYIETFGNSDNAQGSDTPETETAANGPLSINQKSATAAFRAGTQPTSDQAKHHYGQLTRLISKTSRGLHVVQVLKDLWLPEAASLLFAVVVFVGIIVLLATTNGREQPNWPSILNINSLLSILTAVFKAAMLFPIVEGIGELKWVRFSEPHLLVDIDRWDAASKGPWGSIKIICRHPANLLTGLGALIIILALAVDPFAQQVLNFYSCLLPVNGISATIPRTNNYSVGALVQEPGNPFIDGPMTTALYRGFLDPPTNASSIVSAYCPSGNCTFGDRGTSLYSSLAMCSSVQDISEHIIGNGTFEAWDYYLPPNLRIETAIVLASNSSQSTLYSEDNPIYAFQTLAVSLNCSPGTQTPSATNCSTGARAFNVTFSPCLHTYGNISYLDAVFDENVFSTVMLPYTSDGYYSLAGNYPSFSGIDCTPSATPQGNKTQPTSAFANGLRFVNHSYNAYSDPDIAFYDPGCTYDFGYGPASGLYGSLHSVFFAGSVDTPRGLSDQIIGDVWLQDLWAMGTVNITSFNTYLDGITASITAAMREGGDSSNSDQALGQVYGSQTCVSADWPWLALPAALLLLTLVFLVLVVFQSTRHTRLGSAQGGRKPWKSSTLPLLWCGLEDSTRYRFHCFNEVEDMEGSSHDVKVRLRRLVAPVDPGQDGGVESGRARWVLQECKG